MSELPAYSSHRSASALSVQSSSRSTLVVDIACELKDEHVASFVAGLVDA